MIDPHTAAATWRLTNRTERERRDAEEVSGRLVAAVHRLLRRPGRTPPT